MRGGIEWLMPMQALRQPTPLSWDASRTAEETHAQYLWCCCQQLAAGGQAARPRAAQPAGSRREVCSRRPPAATCAGGEAWHVRSSAAFGVSSLGARLSWVRLAAGVCCRKVAAAATAWLLHWLLAGEGAGARPTCSHRACRCGWHHQCCARPMTPIMVTDGAVAAAVAKPVAAAVLAAAAGAGGGAQAAAGASSAQAVLMPPAAGSGRAQARPAASAGGAASHAAQADSILASLPPTSRAAAASRSWGGWCSSTAAA